MRKPILNLRHSRVFPFLVYALSKIYEPLRMIVFIIMIAYSLVGNLVWFAICDGDHLYVLTHLDFKREDQKLH